MQILLMRINFKPFKYKAKLLRNTVAQPGDTNTLAQPANVTIAVPIKHLSNLWRSWHPHD